MKKLCKDCGKIKPTKEFYPSKNTKNGYRAYCKICTKGRNINYRKNNVEHNKNVKRDRHLRIKYNISLKEYNQMYKAQNYKCAICNKPQPSKRRLAVDHDHDTGEVRGLLCVWCNRSLGQFGDNMEGINKVLKYLEKSKQH